MTAKEQLDHWVAGRSLCPNDEGECCPDFSCCTGRRIPREKREAFLKATPHERDLLLIGFLADAIEDNLKQRGLDPDSVYVAGRPDLSGNH